MIPAYWQPERSNFLGDPLLFLHPPVMLPLCSKLGWEWNLGLAAQHVGCRVWKFSMVFSTQGSHGEGDAGDCTNWKWLYIIYWTWNRHDYTCIYVHVTYMYIYIYTHHKSCFTASWWKGLTSNDQYIFWSISASEVVQTFHDELQLIILKRCNRSMNQTRMEEWSKSRQKHTYEAPYATNQ